MLVFIWNILVLRCKNVSIPMAIVAEDIIKIKKKYIYKKEVKKIK